MKNASVQEHTYESRNVDKIKKICDPFEEHLSIFASKF